MNHGKPRSSRPQKPRSPRQQAWEQSDRFKEIGRASVQRINAARASALKCSATAKITGQRCGNLALPNGKCRLHGGRTPKGDGWHKPVWPKASSANAVDRLNRKLRDLERAARKRARRLAAMSAEDRAAYDAWQAAHKPGSAGARAMRRRERRDAAWLREQVAQPPLAAPDREMSSLDARIAKLRNEIALLQTAETNPGDRQLTPEPTTAADPMSLFDDLNDEETQDRAEIIHRARTEGFRIAFETTLALARDTKAPAAARGAAARTLLEIGGALHQRDREAEQERQKDASDMTGDDLRAAASRIVARLDARQPPAEADDGSAFD